MAGMEKKGHIHAELMAQYAEDAKTTDRPWELWQVKCAAGIWHRCQQHPKWECNTGYRRKPKTKLIHGVEIPDFEFTPKVGEEYYTASPTMRNLYYIGIKNTEDCKFTRRMMEFGLVYPPTEEGKQATILHSKAMLGIA